MRRRGRRLRAEAALFLSTRSRPPPAASGSCDCRRGVPLPSASFLPGVSIAPVATEPQPRVRVVRRAGGLHRDCPLPGAACPPVPHFPVALRALCCASAGLPFCCCFKNNFLFFFSAGLESLFSFFLLLFFCFVCFFFPSHPLELAEPRSRAGCAGEALCHGAAAEPPALGKKHHLKNRSVFGLRGFVEFGGWVFLAVVVLCLFFFGEERVPPEV